MLSQFQKYLLSLVALVLVAHSAHGQYFDDLEERAGANEPKAEEPISYEADAPAVNAEDERVLVPALKGLVFFERNPDRESVDIRGLTYFDGVSVFDYALLDTAEFRQRLQYHIGNEVTFKGLEDIGKSVNRYCASIGRPVVKVTLPPQDITGGIVQFGIIEGRLGSVEVTGAKHFNSDQITRQIRINPGDPIDYPQLQKDVNWINSNPFRSVSPIIRSGETFGETNLEIRVNDRLPVAVNARVDNSGSRSTDLLRYTVGGQLGNLWWHGHRASFNFSTNGQTSEYRSYSGSYVVPLPWRHEFQVLGGYSRTRSNSPTNPVTGTSWQVVGRYLIPRHRWLGWDRTISFGGQLSSSDSDFFFGGNAVPLGTTEAAQGNMGLTLSRNDRYWNGNTSLNFNVFAGKASLDGSSNQIEIDSYFYTSLAAQRQWALYNGWSAMTEFEMQWATDTLPVGETFGLGGKRTIRGYDDRIISGDSGWRVRAELRTPGTRLLSRFNWMKKQDQIRGRFFYDYGTAIDVIVLPGGGITDDTPIGSAGLGFAYSVTRSLSLEFDYGWQILRLSDFTDRNQRGHVSLNFAY